jgi:predicted Zn-dependent peptidase
LTDRPPRIEEVNDARRSLIESQARHFETPGALVSRFAHLFLHGLPADYHLGVAARLEAVSLELLVETANRRLNADDLVMVAVGDAGQLLGQLEASGLAVELVDAAALRG